MQRRPPTHSVLRGMIRTVLPRGARPRGASNIDWLYQTPTFCDGISQIGLTNLVQSEQVKLAEYWFRLNFVPFEQDRAWFTLDVSALDGPDELAPGHAPAEDFLVEEFTDSLSAATIAEVAGRLSGEAVEWSPVPPDAPDPAVDDLGASAQLALERVEADLDKAGPGHNQGPPLDPAIVAEIREQVRLGLEAIKTGAAGQEAASSVAGSLITLAGKVSASFVKGLAEEAGKESWPWIKHSLVVLMDHMLHAGAAVGHWIASIPPGPLL